jgi:hypothetical protein
MRLKPSPWGVGIFRHLNSRGSQVRTRLAAGGRWIRTIGPWHETAGFCCGRRIAGTERGQPKRVVSYAVPMVRIHLPPAESRANLRQRRRIPMPTAQFARYARPYRRAALKFSACMAARKAIRNPKTQQEKISTIASVGPKHPSPKRPRPSATCARITHSSI